MMNSFGVSQDAEQRLDHRLGVQMWNLLKQTDIEQAKQELKLRRTKILRRQAEECRILDGDRAELGTLYHLIDAFAQKFKKPATSSHSPSPSPIIIKKIGVQTPPDVRHRNHRDHPRTNFDTFARAVARG